MTDQRHWLLPAALTISLLANLGLAGFIGGALLRNPEEPPRAERTSPGERPQGPARLSDEDRAAIRQLVRSAYEAAGAEFDTRRGAQERLRAALRAEPFDPDAAALAAAEMRAAEAALRERLATELLPSLDTLNAEQRSALARVLAAGSERRGHHRRDSGERPPR
jgi:uncharacterized membrane protein